LKEPRVALEIGLFLARTALACAAAVLGAPALADGIAQGEAFETKHIFGFTEGADIAAPEEREAEFVTTAQVLKRGGGVLRAAEQEATAEGALAPWLGYELTAQGAMVQTGGAPGLHAFARANFSGFSVEPKFVFLKPAEALPLGLALALQPEWTRMDGVSGRNVNDFGLTLRLMADARLDERLYAGLNLIYAPEREQAKGAPVAYGALFGATGALTLRLAPGLALGGEVEAYAATNSLGLGGAVGTAVYLGPTFFARLSPNLFVAGAWSAQVGGRPPGGPDDDTQTDFSRHKARLTVGVAL
jgi:hypothetical protein